MEEAKEHLYRMAGISPQRMKMKNHYAKSMLKRYQINLLIVLEMSLLDRQGVVLQIAVVLLWISLESNTLSKYIKIILL